MPERRPVDLIEEIMLQSKCLKPNTPEIMPECRPVDMPIKLLEAAIAGNGIVLMELLGLNDDDHPPHTTLDVHDIAPLDPSDCLRSVAGMENTILHILSTHGHKNLVSTICMKDGSLLKACNLRGETPFHRAAKVGHVEIILVLIDHAKSVFGEDGLKDLLRQKNCLGETALHEAAKHGHEAIVFTLMEVDLELAGLVNNRSASPLYLATARGSIQMVQHMMKILSEQYSITSDNFFAGPKGQTALHAAVPHGPELFAELLELYGEPPSNWKDNTGITLFHLVVSTGNDKIAKLLLDRDQSLAYIPDKDGSFPVHTAVRMGHVKMIVLLLQSCPDSDELLDSKGRNFLHIAIEANKSHIILELLKKAIKYKLPISDWKKMYSRMLNTMDNDGNTPLHLLAQCGNIGDMFSILEKNKLDLTLQNHDGLTASDISIIKLKESAPNQKMDILGYKYNRDDKGDASDPMKERKERLERVRKRTQLVTLCSVIITTVSFAAGFTLPGGTNQNTGTPILGRKYLFKAFVLADFSAFCLSFLSTLMLGDGSSRDLEMMEKIVDKSWRIFIFSAKCMVMALALGLYLVLDPVGKTSKVVIALSLYMILYDQSNSIIRYYIATINISRLHKLIPHGASREKSKSIGAILGTEFFNLISRVYQPILIPLFFIFVLALI